MRGSVPRMVVLPASGGVVWSRPRSQKAFSLPVLVNAVAALGSVCQIGFGSLLLGCMPGRFSGKIDECM